MDQAQQHDDRQLWRQKGPTNGMLLEMRASEKRRTPLILAVARRQHEVRQWPRDYSLTVIGCVVGACLLRRTVEEERF